MMKNDRQSMILEIISQENIETQEQLLARLQERGISSTPSRSRWARACTSTPSPATGRS